MAKVKKSEVKAMVKLGPLASKGFMEKVKERYVEKYADDVIKMLEDQKKLKRALDRITKFVERVESGDVEAIEQYKKRRARLEENEDEEF